MADHLYSNEATQAERREVLRNDTYFARQSNTVEDNGGRFSKLTPATITGSTPSPQYPQQPANSPWHHDLVAATEPLGFSVDAMEPVGTQAEIEASLKPASIPHVAALPHTEVDRTGEPDDIAPLVSSGSLTKRRSL